MLFCLFCFSAQALRCICSTSLRSSQRWRLPVASSLHCRILGRRAPSSLRWLRWLALLTLQNRSRSRYRDHSEIMSHESWDMIQDESWENVLKSSKISGLKFEPCTHVKMSTVQDCRTAAKFDEFPDSFSKSFSFSLKTATLCSPYTR